MCSDRRDILEKVLITLFANNFKQNLPVYRINNSSLRAYTTTLLDFKLGISHFPTEQFRSHSEDILL